ncbi:MAG: hypothetical protein FWC26_06880 [Fibromonadales bacterium]|nr:hypothetical protein [Fibromonadales bacterium]
MKTLRFAVTLALLGGVSAFATNARVESMGKSSMFIMDDISIFDNPANINLYPNFLIGELGNYLYHQDSVKLGQNRDPLEPWFGGIFSLDIGGGNSLSIAGALNRKEERLFKYFPDKIYAGALKFNPKDIGTQGTVAPDPVTNFDGFLGGNFNNKAFGAHIYIAHQDGMYDNGTISTAAFVSAVQGDIGTNIEINKDNSFEAAFGMARIQYGPRDRSFGDADLFSYFASARFFTGIDAIRGHLIPAANFRNMSAPGREEFEVRGGCGVDAAFDRGFFWMGLNLFYNKQKADSNWVQNTDGASIYRDIKGNKKGLAGDVTQLWQFGGTISFGIERNIWWDWFVIRVGGQKTIAYADYNTGTRNQNSVLCPDKNGCPKDGNYFVTNEVNDGTRNDNVGFGFGINIEEKLKIDMTVAEDVMFRNPFQGEGRLISRVSATYSF